MQLTSETLILTLRAIDRPQNFAEVNRFWGHLVLGWGFGGRVHQAVDLGYVTKIN